jgi:3-hydroxyisobutyrate dehydrogenase-like beta-hydroxyacid dehydrogenase
MAKIALLGTGMIGSAMAARMVEQGHDVTVWNRTLEKAQAIEGARAVASVKDAVLGAERVHVVLSDDAAVDAILSQIPESDAPVIDHTTTSPAGALARAGRRASFLHAPIFMSPAGARAGQGIILVSGDKTRVDAIEPALAAMTGKVLYLGARAELAAAYKLFGNMMILTIGAGLSDVYRLARTLDIDPKDAHALFSKFDPSLTIQGRGAKMAAGDYAPSFETTMARKDLRLMMEACGVLQIVPAVAALLDRAIAEGHGSEDVGALAGVAPI